MYLIQETSGYKPTKEISASNHNRGSNALVIAYFEVDFPMIKNCGCCGIKIQAYGTQKYCDKCKKIKKHESGLRRSRKYCNKRNNNYKTICSQCGVEFRRTEAHKRYCSDRCALLKQRECNVRNKRKYCKLGTEYSKRQSILKIKLHRIVYNRRDKYDINKILSRRMRLQIRASLKSNNAGIAWRSLVGYTLEQLKSRLLLTMPTGHSWDDLFNGRLHIDHIIPKSLFKYSLPSDPEFKQCWALANLQLLTKIDNLKKGVKVA